MKFTDGLRQMRPGVSALYWRSRPGVFERWVVFGLIASLCA
ncbi:hypothetical protein ACTMTI_52565 [Nonomuraea sp. H19]